MIRRRGRRELKKRRRRRRRALMGTFNDTTDSVSASPSFVLLAISADRDAMRGVLVHVRAGLFVSSRNILYGWRLCVYELWICIGQAGCFQS